MKKLLSIVAGLALAGAIAVVAHAGMWTGLPAATSTATTGAGSANSAATLPLTGNETGAFDTNLSGGRNPQTETISVDQLKTYMYGNSGTAGLTANSTATAASGAVTCNAARCKIMTEALTTNVSQPYTLVISSTNILSTSLILLSVENGTNTTTGARITTQTPNRTTGGATTVVIQNGGASALNGNLYVDMVVIN